MKLTVPWWWGIGLGLALTRRWSWQHGQFFVRHGGCRSRRGFGRRVLDGAKTGVNRLDRLSTLASGKRGRNDSGQKQVGCRPLNPASQIHHGR